MWSSWTEKATKGFTEALEKTGEAISQAEKKASKGFTEAFEKTGEAITQVATKAKPRTTQTEDSVGEKGDASDTNENEKQKRTLPGSNLQMSHMNIPNMNVSIPNIDKEKVFKNIQMGWTSVLETTKRTVDATREVVETEKNSVGTWLFGQEGILQTRSETSIGCRSFERCGGRLHHRPNHYDEPSCHGKQYATKYNCREKASRHWTLVAASA